MDPFYVCSACFIDMHHFDPDMGDEIDFHPGTCDRCGRGPMTVFDAIADPATF